MAPLRQHVFVAVLVASALAILGASFAVARQTQIVRVERNREPLRRFASEFQRELHRLERNYESHLSRVARGAVAGDRDSIWRACDQVIGVSQFSLLHRPAEHALDLHVPISVAPPLEPAFAQSDSLRSGALLLLPEKELLRGEETSGWRDEPGQPLIYWERRAADECVVLVIDQSAVNTAMQAWLDPWLRENFVPARIGGPDRLAGPGNESLAMVGTPSAEPADLLLPLRTRFGTWQLASWDPRETRVSYSRGVLLAGSVGALVLLGVGLAFSVQHARALRRAEQRVSFVNAVSHELRAPLTNILLNVELAAEALEADHDAGRRLRYVQEESHRLSRLIENVLTFSRGSRAPRRDGVRACDPVAVIRAAMDQFHPAFARRGLTLTLNAGETGCCLLAPDALMQIMTNLLSNVEKHVPEGAAEITIAREERTLCITVRDHGPGIPSAEAERIFEPFAQLSSRVDAGGSGAGLGLAISRDLALAMNGTLSLQPAANGAIFALRIPFVPPPAIAAA